MSDPSQTSAGEVSIERARVADVNLRQFTVDVYTEETYRKVYDVPFMSPYMSALTGTGMHYMPEPGATCYLAWPDQINAGAFILGWFSPLDDQGGFRGRRRSMEPGDLIMETADGNYVWTRRGGIVEIAATPMCRRFYIPLNNLIRDVAGSYRLQTLGGAWDWSVDREENDPKGDKPVRFAMGIKELANAEKYIVTLDVAGAVGSNDDEALLDSGGNIKSSRDLENNATIQMKMYNPADGFSTVINYQAFKDGVVDIKLERGVDLTATEYIVLRALEGNITLEALKGGDDTGNMDLSASGKRMAIQALNGNVEMTAKLMAFAGKAEFSGGDVTFKASSPVSVGNAPVAVVVDAGFIESYNLHVHQAVPPAPAVTGPPQPLLVPAAVTSSSLKSTPG